MQDFYPFQLIPLGYEYNALEPYIDEETMHFHHDKHLKTYVDNLNNILKDYPNYHHLSLVDIIKNIHSFPLEIRQKVNNNAGGVYNHNLYFKIINPKYLSSNKDNKLLKKINKQYGSIDEFLNKFKEKANEVFGSGYTFLVLNAINELEIINLSNQDNPLKFNLKPILLVDLWEHAYYLKYKNERKQYIENFVKLINFDIANDIYLNYCGK